MFKALSTLLKRPVSLPAQWQNRSLNNAPLLALDLELTSLNTKTAKITSIAWVQGSHQQIELASCFYNVVRASGDLAQSPVIHGLTAKDLLQGAHVEEVIAALSVFLKTHIWVLHNAALDMTVLGRVAMLLKIKETQIISIDTMQLELYLLNKQGFNIQQDSVMLGNCRRRYALPSAPNHNALDDALATLQLCYAQLYVIDKTSTISLRDLLHTGAVQTHTVGITPR